MFRHTDRVTKIVSLVWMVIFCLENATLARVDRSEKLRIPIIKKKQDRISEFLKEYGYSEPIAVEAPIEKAKKELQTVITVIRELLSECDHGIIDEEDGSITVIVLHPDENLTGLVLNIKIDMQLSMFNGFILTVTRKIPSMDDVQLPTRRPKNHNELIAEIIGLLLSAEAPGIEEKVTTSTRQALLAKLEEFRKCVSETFDGCGFSVQEIVRNIDRYSVALDLIIREEVPKKPGCDESKYSYPWVIKDTFQITFLANGVGRVETIHVARIQFSTIPKEFYTTDGSLSHVFVTSIEDLIDNILLRLREDGFTKFKGNAPLEIGATCKSYL